MDFTIERTTEQTLVLHQKGDYSLGIWLFGAASLLIVPVFFSQELGLLSLGAFGLSLLGLYILATEEELTCTLDKSAGSMVYKRRSWGDKEIVETPYRLADLQAVVIKQQVVGRRGRGRDVFQLRLLLKSGVLLEVSAARLKLSTAQDFAQQIQQFVGPQVVVKGEDG